LVFAELKIHPATELINVSRAGKNATQHSEVRCEQLRADDSTLVEAFKSAEEKSTIFPQWASNSPSELLALEKWIGIEWVSM
jgi:hypothetical protein